MAHQFGDVFISEEKRQAIISEIIAYLKDKKLSIASARFIFDEVIEELCNTALH